MSKLSILTGKALIKAVIISLDIMTEDVQLYLCIVVRLLAKGCFLKYSKTANYQEKNSRD